MFKVYQIKWGIFLCFAFAVLGFLQRVGDLEFGPLALVKNYLFFSFLNVFTCWFIHHYFILHAFKHIGNITKGIISNILAICIVLFFDYLVILFTGHPLLNDARKFDSIQNIMINFTRTAFVSVFIYIIIYNIQINITLQKSKLENELLKQAQLKAQLLSLQQQVSPHFLFNSLSTLKTIASDQETKTYVIQLANVYRYLLNFNEHHLASLKDEIAFMKSYLYILQERFEQALQISIDVPGGFLSYYIPPLSLQLLIENAIKHNIISPEQPLQIRIYTDQTPALTIENSYQPKQSVEESTGKGLQNIKDRYLLLADKQIEVCKTDNLFKVILPLLQHERINY
ncbi:MAG: histidine kinase [Bacteroidota bacterium]|nr:histidine kinase [Bacteroidota bacterium]